MKPDIVVIIVCLKVFLPGCDGVFLPELFRGWLNTDAGQESCDGTCQLSLTCWIQGAVVSPDGDCNSLFRVSAI